MDGGGRLCGKDVLILVAGRRAAIIMNKLMWIWTWIHGIIWIFCISV